jgi:phytoene dehydrogenase-like protein
MQGYFKDHYSVIIIGSALSGMAAALELSQKGLKDILVLEQHNLPGGLATSFVRGGAEMEATLHEMMSIGENSQLSIGKFFKDNGIDISWVRVPDAFRYVDKDTDVLVHGGTDGNMEMTAREIASVVEDDGKTYKETLRFLNLCLKVYQGMNYIAEHKISKAGIILKYPDVAQICGYSVKEVLDSFDLPKKVRDVLSAYWVYIGNEVSDMPAMIYCFMLADYLGYGAYIPRHCSHEMSLKMAEKCLERGVTIEYGKRVDKILVRDGRVKGVRLMDGTEIASSYVIAGCYPNMVYTKMIEPAKEVPSSVFPFYNSKKLSLSCFSVVLLLDASPEKLNIHDYSTFYAPDGLDFDIIIKDFKGVGPYRYVTSICPTLAYQEEKDETIYSMTALPFSDGWLGVTEDNYNEMKQRNARYFIELESKRLGVNLSDHIKEIVIETPVTISHYTGAYRGLVYGYQHTMDDTILARMDIDDRTFFIHGLAFAGAHQTSGDGMGPAIANGRKAAKDIQSFMKKDKEERRK